MTVFRTSNEGNTLPTSLKERPFGCHRVHQSSWCAPWLELLLLLESGMGLAVWGLVVLHGSSEREIDAPLAAR